MLQRSLISLALVSLAPFAASWAEPNAAVKVSASALQAHAEFLASDLLEGRATASRGYELAAAYVAAQFRQYGLAPLGDNGGYFQAVPLLEATAVLPGSSAILRKDGEETRFEYGRDFLPSPDFLANTSTLSAPLVFAGFGVTAPELSYDDLANVDVQGRIAVVLSQAPPRFKPMQRAYYSSSAEKYANLIRHGASGVVTIDMPGDDAQAAWERRVAMSWVPQMRLLTADSQAADAYPELKLRFDFNGNAAEKLFAGSGRSLEQAMAAATRSEPQAFALPGLLTLSATTGLRRTESSNIVGLLRGSDPKLRNEYVVFAAHLDHLGRGPAINGDGIYNGLQDNAIGMAMLLETARVLANAPERPKRSILFAAVTAAEQGALGAEHLLKLSNVPADGVTAALDIDTPLPLARTADLIVLGIDQSSLGRIATETLEAQGLRLSPADAERNSLWREDAAAFIRAGIPVLSLKSGTHAKRGLDAPALKQEYLQNHYRQPSDDNAATPVDYGAAAELASVSARLIFSMADTVAKPYWYRDSKAVKKARPPTGENP